MWTQESQILDGGSVHHCAATVKKEVLPVLEKDLEEQVEVVRETEKKKRREEEIKKSEETAKTVKDKGMIIMRFEKLFSVVIVLHIILNFIQ